MSRVWTKTEVSLDIYHGDAGRLASKAVYG